MRMTLPLRAGGGTKFMSSARSRRSSGFRGRARSSISKISRMRT